MEEKYESNLELLDPEERPRWLVGNEVNEVLFGQYFQELYEVRCIDGKFFGLDGPVPSELVEQMIYEEIKPYIWKKIGKTIHDLMDAVKRECYLEPKPPDEMTIHVANGTLFADGLFTNGKSVCRNRLPVSYNPGAPEPERWNRFLNDLLYPEDIPTLQEYMGYCLIPTTRGQRMLMLVGRGGEGKSRIGVVMHALLGSSMNTGSIAKLENNRFARADVEHKLLLVDDDMKLEALPQTNIIKSIVTAELPMDMERKGVQSHQGAMYARLMGFGNGTLKSLYDRSLGFFRRQIILTTKDRPPDRVDDPFLSEKLITEAEGIFLWAFVGLQRLIANDFRFTVSERSQENLQESIEDGNNVVPFLHSEGYISFKADFEISSTRLYERYVEWCTDNALHALTQTGFLHQMAALAEEYHLERTNNVHERGKRVRGFVGIYAIP